MRFGSSGVWLCFLLPALVYTVMMFLFPIVFNVYLSFRHETAATIIQGTGAFIGLGNYKGLLQDSHFLRTVRNTLIFTPLTVFFQLFAGMSLALLLHKPFPGQKAFQTLLLLPLFLPLIVTGTVWRWFFMEKGLLNFLIVNVGIVEETIGWISDPAYSLASIILVTIWYGFPFQFIILYTGLRSIAIEYYEAASLDGASRLQTLRYITIPVLKPVILSVLMLSLVYTIRHFDVPWIVTRGGPGDSSHLFSTYAYQVFRQYRFGPSTAVSNVMVFLILVIVGFYNRIRRGGES